MRMAHGGGVEQCPPPDAAEPGTATLLAFSAPMLVIVGVELAWRVYLPAHLSGTFGLSLAAIGTLLLAARLFDMAADPVVAWASDRFATRWGHRRPWLVASLPPLLLGIAGLFFAGPSVGIAAVVVAGLALHLGYTLLATPHGGWALELAGSPRGRMRVMTARTWVALAGVVMLLIAPSVLERALDADRAAQVAALGWTMLVLTPLTIVLALRSVTEPPPVPCTPSTRRTPWRTFVAVLAMPTLWPILLLYLLAGLAEAGSAAIFLLLVDRALDLPGWGSSLLLVQAIATLVALPLWGRIGQAIGGRSLLTLFYGWQMLTLPLALVLPGGSIVAATVFMLARGAMGGVDFMALRAMVADNAGTARERGMPSGAICYSVSNMTLRLGMGVGPLLVFASLASAGITDVAAPIDLPTDSQAALRLIYVAPLFLSALFGMIFALRHRGFSSHTVGEGGVEREEGDLEMFVTRAGEAEHINAQSERDEPDERR